MNVLSHLCQRLSEVDVSEVPFPHICFVDVFPSYYYAELLRNLPPLKEYKPLAHREAVQQDGSSTRYELRLYGPNKVNLSAFWLQCANMLASSQLRDVLFEKLGRKTGIKVYPRPVLMRDFFGYYITPHTDTGSKLITVQFYLPVDDRMKGDGTGLCEPIGEERPEVKRIPFLPNSGYAFAVSDRSWHQVARFEGVQRNSLMLIYYDRAGK